MQIEPPGQPRVRVKISPQWYINRDALGAAWVTYTLQGGLEPQVLKVQYPRATKRPARVIPLTDEQQLFLKVLLGTGQTPLPGQVIGGGCCDGDLIELSLSSSAVLASYSWDGHAPKGWEDLGQIVDFVTGLAAEADQG